MAAYRRVDDLTVTCRLTACTPGSAPGPTFSIEYGKAFTFTFTIEQGSHRLCTHMERHHQHQSTSMTHVHDEETKKER